MFSRALSSAAALVLVPVLAPSPGGVALAGDLVPNEVVVGFHDGVPRDAAPFMEGLGGEVLYESSANHWISARFGDAHAAAQAMVAARGRPDVRYAEHDGYAYAAFRPDDPRFDEQWGYPAVRAPGAWDRTVGSHLVKVALLDTGIEAAHADLAPNMCGPFTSFVPTEPTIDDMNGHGTHVAGTLAAVTGNGIGVSGMSQSCIMGAKVMARDGRGQWSWVAAAIEWSVANGADIISMSLGGAAGTQVLRDAAAYAYVDHDVLLVAAAGNGACGLDPVSPSVSDNSVMAPASYDAVMAVAALVPPTGAAAASFSSCGADMEIAAPGVDIVSTAPGGTYATMSGTSMAAPHVAGAAALLLAQDPTLPAMELRCILDLSADELGRPGRDPNFGWGRLNARVALERDQLLTDQLLHERFTELCRDGAVLVFE